MRVNISLIGSHIIRGPKSISINSYFFILPLQVIKNKFYTAELRAYSSAGVAESSSSAGQGAKTSASGQEKTRRYGKLF